MYNCIILISSLLAASNALYNPTPATIKEFPHMVSIGTWKKSFRSFCSGSIISKNWVISSSPRVDPEDVDDYMALSGTDYDGNGNNGTLHRPDKVVLFENHKFLFMSKVFLMRVVEPFVFGETRQPIKMFESSEKVTPGSVAKVSGFGLFEVDSQWPDKLAYAELPTMDTDKCSKFYLFLSSIISNEPTQNDFVCVDQSGISDQGVWGGYLGGGPLTIDGRLAGVIGYFLGRQINLDIQYQDRRLFFDVTHLRDWIDHEIK